MKSRNQLASLFLTHFQIFVNNDWRCFGLKVLPHRSHRSFCMLALQKCLQRQSFAVSFSRICMSFIMRRNKICIRRNCLNLFKFVCHGIGKLSVLVWGNATKLAFGPNKNFSSWHTGYLNRLWLFWKVKCWSGKDKRRNKSKM